VLRIRIRPDPKRLAGSGSGQLRIRNESELMQADKIYYVSTKSMQDLKQDPNPKLFLKVGSGSVKNYFDPQHSKLV
jgi:hypothetical protein